MGTCCGVTSFSLDLPRESRSVILKLRKHAFDMKIILGIPVANLNTEIMNKNKRSPKMFQSHY